MFLWLWLAVAWQKLVEGFMPKSWGDDGSHLGAIFLPSHITEAPCKGVVYGARGSPFVQVVIEVGGNSSPIYSGAPFLSSSQQPFVLAGSWLP